MPNKERDPDAALRKLGEHVRQSRAKRHPISERTLESVREAIRKKWEQEQQAKSDDSHARFLCPRCSQKLSVDLNDLVKTFEARRSPVFGRMICPSCNHLIRLPGSIVSRVRRKSSLGSSKRS